MMEQVSPTMSLIVAVSENNVIGKENKLPWYLPADLKFFKNTTWAMPVVMGRKTYESLGKPLPGRTNIVISRNSDWKAAGVILVSSLDAAVKEAAALDVKEVFVIGGAQIFQSALPLADKLYLTRIHETFEGDTFFPALDPGWKLASRKDFQADEKNLYAYSFETWEKIKTAQPVH
jgi:dihydrofolate reductase